MFNSPYNMNPGGFQPPMQSPYSGFNMGMNNPYMQQLQNQMQQQQVPAQQQPQQQFDWIRVNTLEDVKNVSVQPGGKAWIMLQNDPVFVVKTADAMGLATTQAFKFEPYNPQQAPVTEYAPLAVVQQLEQQIQVMAEELNSMKGVGTRGKSSKQSVQSTGANFDKANDQ